MCCGSVIASTSAPAATSARVTAGAATAESDTVEDVGRRAVLVPAVDAGQAAKTRSGSASGARVWTVSVSGEQLVAELLGPADRAQRRVEDRDPVAQALGLLEPMGRQEDRDAPLAEPVDQLVDLARRDRVEPRGRLVEEQDLRIAEQRPGQRDPLAKSLGQGAAGIVGPVDQVDRMQRAVDARARVGHLVQVGEALEVLERRSGGGTGPATPA